MVEGRCEKNYNFFIDTLVHIKNIFEYWSPGDIFSISELPYPIFNDLLLRQIKANEKTASKLLNNNQINKKIPPRKRRS